MKFTSTVLMASGLVASTSAIAPSRNTIYKLKVNSTIKGLGGSILSVIDESADSSATPLGVWNTGEPRKPYTFTLSTSALSDKLYEVNGSLKKTHLILHGDIIAMGLYDVAIGAEPKASDDEALFTNQFLAVAPWDGSKLALYQAENFKAGATDEKTFVGPGSWRACKGDSEAAFPDYQLVWFDGLHNLTQLFGVCDSVGLDIVEHQQASTTSPWITGVPAPSTTDAKGNWVTGVPLPSNNVTSTGSPTPKSFEGVASHLGPASILISAMVGAVALAL
ncbi:hypothetical protein P280DRAFT_548797 [Massarina eburnea CBS 473.64]|uniref:Uncharacterized protein n=1 Tax=Massarina eburnea CBS 473.64 TaxID=1395130 RepID=A0A6A6S4B1_9PLEO|nr:hypothetical protein P280DRAFT_548797 [Massarina eburnea CBS 473.64]